MKFCPKCGHQLKNPNAKFCDKCGSPIKQTQPTASNQQPSPNRLNLILTLVIIVLVLMIGAGIYLFTSGATNQVSTKQPTATTKKANNQTKSNAKATTSDKKEQQDTALWNASKSAKLSSFMSAWGSDMNQDYDSYDPSHQDNYMGYHFPEVLSKGNIRVNETPVSIGWSKDGTGKNDYNVVAIYSDIDTDRNKGKLGSNHLYLFTIHNGEPVALVTQQNQGNPENAIYFKPTANQDVSGQFANIVKNDKMDY